MRQFSNAERQRFSDDPGAARAIVILRAILAKGVVDEADLAIMDELCGKTGG